jgi:L-ribulokinase
VSKLDGPLLPLGARAGGLTARAAAWTGLPEGIAVAVGNVDAHVTAASAQALDPGRMVAIMGTSTCHVVNGEKVAEVAGMCGVADGGISAGAWGYEAGQSGVGDIFGWFVDQAAPDGYASHERLSELAAAQPVGAHGLVALDWWNGNRSLLVNHDLSGLIVGLTLATRPPDVYRALLEATAYGTRMIIEAFTAAGVPVSELVVAGGLTSNRLLMQIYADVTDRPLSLIGSAQGPALGSAIHAAVAAGAYPDVPAASAVMGRVERAVYRPDPGRARAYDALYAEYRALHDHFGRGGDDVMLRLRAIRNAARESALEVAV